MGSQTLVAVSLLLACVLVGVVSADSTCYYDLYQYNGTQCVKQAVDACFPCQLSTTHTYYYRCEAEGDYLECHTYTDNLCFNQYSYAYPSYEGCQHSSQCALFYSVDKCTEDLFEAYSDDTLNPVFWMGDVETSYYETGPLQAYTNGTYGRLQGRVQAASMQFGNHIVKFNTYLPGTNSYETNLGICDIGDWCNVNGINYRLTQNQNVTTDLVYTFLFDLDEAGERVGFSYDPKSDSDDVIVYLDDDQRLLFNVQNNDFTGYTVYLYNGDGSNVDSLTAFEFYEDSGSDMLSTMSSEKKAEFWWWGWWWYDDWWFESFWWFDWWWFESVWWESEEISGVLSYQFNSAKYPYPEYSYTQCNQEYDYEADLYYFHCDFDEGFDEFSSFWWFD